MASDYIEVQISSHVDAGDVMSLLGDSSVQGAWEDERSIHLYWPTTEWSLDRLAQLRRTLRHLIGPGLPEADVVVRTMQNQDWNRQWAESVKPLWIGRRLVVRPSWESVAIGSDQIEIILDPKQAFGTGQHATTRMLLEWLEHVIQGGETVLDVGTGSGLLAMVALRLGANTAVGIDHDADAIDCAREYAFVNGFGPELSLQCGIVAGDRPYDLVLANLDRQTLLQLAAPLEASTGRMLLVSGLLRDQCAEIEEAFARVDLFPCSIREQDGYVAIEFRRAQSCEGA
jgi:ribosomal protein L11 methyltransferase